MCSRDAILCYYSGGGTITCAHMCPKDQHTDAGGSLIFHTWHPGWTWHNTGMLRCRYNQYGWVMLEHSVQSQLIPVLSTSWFTPPVMHCFVSATSFGFHLCSLPCKDRRSIMQWGDMKPLGKALEKPQLGQSFWGRLMVRVFRRVLLHGPAVWVSTGSRGDAAICRACAPTYQMNRAI